MFNFQQRTGIPHTVYPSQNHQPHFFSAVAVVGVGAAVGADFGAVEVIGVFKGAPGAGAAEGPLVALFPFVVPLPLVAAPPLAAMVPLPAGLTALLAPFVGWVARVSKNCPC